MEKKSAPYVNGNHNIIVNSMNCLQVQSQQPLDEDTRVRPMRTKRLIDRIKSRIDQKRWFFSLEFFPPRTANGAANLYQKIERLTKEKPLFCDVTWHPAGDPASLSKTTSSMVIAGTMLNYCGVDTMLHVTCYGYKKEQIIQHLQSAKELGIRNILALRGDKPTKPRRRSSVSVETQAQLLDGDTEMAYAVDLVRLIRAEFGSYFCIGVAGYPNGHPEAPSYEADLLHLKEKVDAGAEFIITQLFFRVADFERFVADCVRIGINVPIIPGLMPIQAYASLRHVVALSKLSVPDEIVRAVDTLRDDDEAIRAFGVDLGARTCLELLAGGACGVHFYTLNREAAVLAILERLRAETHRGLIPSAKLRLPTSGNGIDTVDKCNEKQFSRRHPPICEAGENGVGNDMNIEQSQRWLPWKQSGKQSRKLTETVRPIFWSERPNSYLYRTSHWDEFPNGRWGNSNAASFGDLRDYHLFYLSPLNALSEEELRSQLLAEPRTVADLASVFCCYLTRQPNAHGCLVDSLPWSDSSGEQGGKDDAGAASIGRETALILDDLVAINRLEYLTINSQPPCDGAPSNDPVFGWGPPRGYVYQKAYLEFFCSRRRAAIIRSLLDAKQRSAADGSLRLHEHESRFALHPIDGRLLVDGCCLCEEADTRNAISAAAAVTDVDEQLDCRVNYHIRDASGSIEWRNYADEQPAAVTWGVFPGREVIQPTVVDPAAFRIWSREAFDLWLTYWAALYPTDSESYGLLNRVHDNFCLVNVVDNDYKKPNCLFDLLRAVAQIDEALGPDPAVDTCLAKL